MKKQLLAVGCGVLALAVLTGVGTSTYYGYEAMKKIGTVDSKVVELNDVVKKAVPDENENKKEDDIAIDGQYVIKSTKQISDAYISGNKDDLSEEDKETLDMASKIIDKIIKFFLVVSNKRQYMFYISYSFF